jgi:hypothetical protein
LTLVPPRSEERRQWLSALLREQPRDVVVLFGWRQGKPVFSQENDDRFDELVLLAKHDVVAELEEHLGDEIAAARALPDEDTAPAPAAEEAPAT